MRCAFGTVMLRLLDGAARLLWLFSSDSVRLMGGVLRCRDGRVALRLRVRAVLVCVFLENDRPL
jgi:hypothetical protein